MSALLDYDTGPLNWVRGDIDAALQAALARIQAYSIDADLTNALRLAADDAHQVTGALRMVGLEGAATLAATLESSLAAIDEGRLQPGSDLLRALRNALEGLQRWVKALAEGRGSGELALFPLYKHLRELQGFERVFEGELFFPDLRSRIAGDAERPGISQEALAAEVKAARGQFQRGLLSFLRNVDAEQGLRRMREALVRIEHVAPSQASQSFWWACVGFVDSLLAHGVEADFHVKQLLARVDMQMRRLMQGSPEVAERLMRDALFFVAKSKALDGRAAEIHSTLGLDRYLPGRGLLDPEALARMRPVLDALQAGLVAARDNWHAGVEGDPEQYERFRSQLTRMQPQAQMLDGSGLAALLHDLDAAAETAARRGGARDPESLEVAATLLFLQNAVEQEDILHADFAARAAARGARLRALTEGRELPATPADPDSRRETERDMLTHLARAVEQNLRQMEEGLDAFFRDPAERAGLATLPALAQEAQGALTMLELPEAARLLAAAMDLVRPFIDTGHPDAATQQRLADAFSGLGLFIESHCAGRADAARVLNPVLVDFGLRDAAALEGTDTAPSGPDGDAKKKSADDLTSFAAAPPDAWTLALADVDAPIASRNAAPLMPVEQAAAHADAGRNPVAPEPETIDLFTPEPLPESAVPVDAADGVLEFYATADASAPTDAARDDAGLTAVPAAPQGVDPELLDIFLEEAKDVLETMGDAATTCQHRPDDDEALTTIRRGFHTLKGSSRMVGLTAFGETAWHLEHLMNGWLAEKRPASRDLLRLVTRARHLFLDWVQTLQAGGSDEPSTVELLADVERAAARPDLDAGIRRAAPPESGTGAADAGRDDVAEAPVAIQNAGLALDVGPATDTGNPTSEGVSPAGIEISPVPPAARFVEVAADETLDRFDASWRQHEQPAAETAEVPAETVSVDVCFGTHCLSGGLYEIFVMEARQRLAVLQDEAQRQGEAGGESVREDARRAVHTLAGIAGTAGLTALAALSHALEGYWNRFTHAPLPPSQLQLVEDTVARLGEMVVAIEAGRMPDAADDLIAALGELEDAPAQVAVHPLPAASPGETASGEPAAPMPPPALVDASVLVADIRPHTTMPVFERREVADEIDAQLLPVFLEEAESLVPDTSEQLRAWKASPESLAARAALRRNLHTIKGSARMVGAMRLGELTHVMEARVVAVIEGQLAASPDVFETLESQFDRMADAVDQLKRGELQTLVEPPASADALAERAPVHVDAAPAGAAAASRAGAAPAVTRESSALTLRVRADWVDRMVNQAGEVAIARSRIESEVFAFKRHVGELTEALARLRSHIREVEIQAEAQMQATFQAHGGAEEFDPLEFDRFTRFQEVTRFLAESVNDISTVQHILLARLGEADAALVQQMRLNRELQQDLLRVRMVPLYSVAERLYRTVRQTARDVGKRAQLDIQGGDLEIDRSVLEKVTAPLEHLLRNALAHGIESPDARRAALKPEFGEIVLSARQVGNEMILTVADDGAGLDYARIREKAEAGGLLSPGIEPTEPLLAQLIFAAGFSTAESVSEVAGRGVGMDVVKSEIAALGGRIDIDSVSGHGTVFNIYLPLTLAMTQAVMVHAAKHDYALPAPLVRQVLELRPDELAAAMAAGEVAWRGASYPLSYLPHLLGDTDAVHEVQRYNPVALLASGASQAAVLLDAIEGTREIVIKNIGPQMARITGVAGATVGGDGRVILILNPVPLAQRWASRPRHEIELAAPAETPELSAALQAPMVLVVDDSLTVRKITTRLLAREGFRVESAKDGVDALEKMHDLVPDVLLLDVEMPRMDGFELTRVMRADERLRSVPIVMITSRTADKHRNRALELGVNAYLGKPYQEQQLLDTIAEQLEQQPVLPA